MTAAYQFLPNGFILRESDGAQIPPVIQNSDYRDYLVWAATAGNVTDALPIPVLTPAQQVANALNAGLAITSTSAPALSGTYAVTQDMQLKLDAITTFILANGTFPEDATTYEWPDTAEVMHVLPSIAEFKLLATAIANYVNLLDLFALGIGSALPAATATIA